MSTAHVSAAPADPAAPGVRAGLAAVGAMAQQMAAAAVTRPWIWLIFVAALWALPLGRALTRSLPASPPVLGAALPAFALTTERGDALESAHMRGRVWILQYVTLDGVQDAAWVDTHLRLQHRLRNMGDSARILTLTLDPMRDTPERMYRFARAQHANPYQWTFATDGTQDLHNALSAELRAHRSDLLVDSTMAGARYYALLDPDLHIRGFYPPDTAGIEALIVDCGLIANLYTPAPSPAGAST